MKIDVCISLDMTVSCTRKRKTWLKLTGIQCLSITRNTSRQTYERNTKQCLFWWVCVCVRYKQTFWFKMLVEKASTYCVFLYSCQSYLFILHMTCQKYIHWILFKILCWHFFFFSLSSACYILFRIFPLMALNSNLWKSNVLSHWNVEWCFSC